MYVAINNASSAYWRKIAKKRVIVSRIIILCTHVTCDDNISLIENAHFPHSFSLHLLQVRKYAKLYHHKYAAEGYHAVVTHIPV